MSIKPRAYRVMAIVGLGLMAVFVLLLAVVFWPRGLKDWPSGWDKPITNSIGMKFAPIPKGTFWRGATKEIDAEADDDEGPRREIGISAFHMGIHEVTQAEYERVMGTNPNPNNRKDQPNFPERVNFHEAVEFCKKLSALPEEIASGHSYRLPTEAEWEYSCRGPGATYSKFHTGETLTKDQANIEATDQEIIRGSGDMKEVGSYKANAFGLHDMHGNIAEWCADGYGSYPTSGEATDPRGASWLWSLGQVTRGGGYSSSSKACRSAYRDRRVAWIRHAGFRVALVPQGR